MIQQVEAALEGSERQRFVESSDTLGRALEDGLRGSRFAQVEEACQELEQLLESLPGVGMPATARILALARTAGSTGKVSGAGGGDGCVLFSPDEDSRRALLAALGHRGFVAVPLSVEPGVRAEDLRPARAPLLAHGLKALRRADRRRCRWPSAWSPGRTRSPPG